MLEWRPPGGFGLCALFFCLDSVVGGCLSRAAPPTLDGGSCKQGGRHRRILVSLVVLRATIPVADPSVLEGGRSIKGHCCDLLLVFVFCGGGVWVGLRFCEALVYVLTPSTAVQRQRIQSPGYAPQRCGSFGGRQSSWCCRAQPQLDFGPRAAVWVFRK